MLMEKSWKIVQVWLPILILLGATKLISSSASIPLRQLMLDPTEAMRVPFYTGIIANLGILLWAATASICLYISIFLGHWMSRAWKNFFLVSGLLTLLLLADDALRLHDEILPVYLGIKGDFLGIIYVLLVVLYLFLFRGLIFQHSYIFLAMALGLFAVSAATDVATRLLKDRFVAQDLLLVEDGAKVLGLANWLAYFVFLGVSVLGKTNLALSTPTADD